MGAVAPSSARAGGGSLEEEAEVGWNFDPQAQERLETLASHAARKDG
jgi:hypothetical protein